MEPVQQMQPNRTMPNDNNTPTNMANNDPAQPVWIPIELVSSGESI
jgi:hypothetical protein